ncbi:PLP-dependent aminotransferase family protein [Pseudomonas yamanorum]|uniref:aminotransferase-like domain-containing protein n=1 Tax=Pseudomonas yamanorum TaxID=515393 RepID=UPI001C474C97|nr:PLP-dependent aminotransferase family protein [Pseudomonas yamanorum]MBV6664083.1 PLP-dependent aminotransferase family protein [Pseudomonas yamanorum]
MTIALEPSAFDDPVLNVINLLNSLSSAHPEAISLASGRPDDELCDPALIYKGLASYERYVTNAEQSLSIRLCQYGKTSGIINEILAEHLRVDEEIVVSNVENIVVCMGFQEAATLALLSIFDNGGVLLVPDPVFSGITGIAKLLRVKTVPVPMADFLDSETLSDVVDAIESSGEKVKALYAISDFSNPTADSLSFEGRKALVALARARNFLILEDNAYRYFRYEGARIPLMKSIESSRVVLMGSFAKSIFPGLRMGYLMGPEDIEATSLSTKICKAKSLITVNTSALCQAVVGGLLIENDYSLKALNEPKTLSYLNKRNWMIRCLEEHFPLNANGQRAIIWNAPEGGFFINVQLPIRFGYSEMQECAAQFKVIVFPTSFFSLMGTGIDQVRLSFSSATASDIPLAIGRLKAYIELKMQPLALP